jgi:glycosyltransferase involved in cell wall biosynthesis
MTNKSTLSVVISAYNEEKKIDACLHSVLFADEIIVIDNTSTDNTIAVAKKYTQKLYKRKNYPMLNINKNFGFTKATCEWILCLDADERISDDLRKEIENTLKKTDSTIKGYWIARKNIIFGKWIQNSIWWPDYQLRLFRKGAGKFPEKHVHEMLHIDGVTEKLQFPMEHENYDTVSQYIYKLDRIYTENEASQIIASGKKVTWIDAIRFPVNDFLKTFFAQKGYKDGLHGLQLSILQAFYASIVFAKVWEKQGFVAYNNNQFLQDIYQESKHIIREFQYWFYTSFLNTTKNPIKKIFFRLHRKLLKIS